MKLIEKIKDFFKIFKKNDALLTEAKENIEEKTKETFLKTIDIKESLDLQTKLEGKEISIDDLSIFEVMELIELYEGKLCV